jgi:hypothetical protein
MHCTNFEMKKPNIHGDHVPVEEPCAASGFKLRFAQHLRQRAAMSELSHTRKNSE